MTRTNFLIQYFLAIVFIVIFNTPVNAGWGGIGKTETYAGDALNRIGDIFIKYNVCTDKKRDCSQKDVISYAWDDSDMYLIAYLVTDMQMANEIIQVAIDEFRMAQENGDNDLTIHLLLDKKSHKTGFFSSLHEKWFVQLIINGEEK